MSLLRWRSGAVLPLGVFLLGFCMAIAGGLSRQQELDAQAQAAFERGVARVRDEIVQRFREPAEVLNGMKALYAMRPTIRRADFAAYVEALALAQRAPGIRGLGFVQRVVREDLPRFVAAERADGEPAFAIRQLVDKDLPDLFVVKFNEPPGPNSGALGLDLGSEARRRATVQRAIDSGEPTLTAPITLVQDRRHRPGVLLFVPVYARGAPLATPLQRRAAALGLLSAPIVLDELLDGVHDVMQGQLDFELFDASDAATVLYRGHRATGHDAESTAREPRYRAEQMLALQGRDFTLRVTGTARFDAAYARSTPWLVFGGATLVSALLALLVWQQGTRRRLAESMARRMTAELERLAQVVKHTSNAVSIADRELRITWVNEGFTRITGYTLAEALGKTLGELLGSGKAGPEVLQKLADSAAGGTACRLEILNRAKDGREYWIDTEVQPLRDANGKLAGFMEIGSDVTATKRAERELARERASLANIIEGTGVGTWEVNVESGEVRLNARWAQIVGYTLDELSPTTVAILHRLLHPDDRALSKERYERHVSGAAPAYECEVRLRHKDGHWVWVYGRGKMFSQAQDGAPRWIVGTHKDISERKRVEAELRQSNEVMHSVLESLPCGLSVFDADLNLVAWNTEFRRLLDLPDTLFRGAPVRFEDLARFNAERGEYGKDDVEKLVRDRMAQVAPPLAPHRFERIRPDGTPIEVSGAPMPGGGFVSTYIDLSSRRKAEAQALRASNLLRGSIDALDDAFALYDPEDRLVLCNQRYRDLYSLCAEMMVPGASFESIIRAGAERGQYPAAAGRVDAWVAERMALHRQPSSQLQQRLADGRVLRIIERRMPDGHTVGYRVDITELVRATEAAEAASRAKTQFLANVSHEIRTPMSAILGMLTLLQRTPLAPAQRDYAAKGEGAARSLLGLLNEILDFAKTEQGKTTLDAQPFRLDTLLAEVQAVASGLVGRKGLAVQFDVDPALPPELIGDAMRLMQVLVNLVGNAVKFTESGTVNVKVCVCERVATAVTLEFAVIDTGIGIAEGDLQRIFNAFTQAEASTTRRFGGTGLGLAISQQLVRLMGGELGVESVLGRGSRFHFRVVLAVSANEGIAPAAPTNAPAAQAAPWPAANRPRPQRLAGLRILIVEDNADIRLIASELLCHEGALTQLANHGQDALDQLAADARFDAVLMDLQMPVMDGLTAAGHIRGRLGLTALPIIAVSANAMASDRQACLAAGMNDHVGKPFDSSDLVRALLRHTGRREVAAPDAPAEPEMLSEALCAAAARADVDIRAALKRLGSGTSVYRRLLRGLRSELETLPERLRALLAQRDTGDAARALHSLEGLAATLGALRLSAVAAQGETQLMTDQAADAAQQAVERTCEAIAAARPGLEALSLALRSEPDSDGPSGPTALPATAEGGAPVRAAARESLGRLARLLGESDMEALRAMEALRRDFGALLGAALNPLDEATQALDFVRARQLCRELEQATPEGHAA
jgi:PAS domain S-box-containing protein